MSKPDISNCTYKELAELRHEITSKMVEMRDNGITQLRATIAEQAQMLGVEISELVPKKLKRKRRTRSDGDGASDHDAV